MQVVAINWQVYLLTHSAISLGLIGLSRFLPVMIFALVGGAAADIYNRRKIMIAAQLVMTLSSLILAEATYTHQITPLIIYVSLSLAALASAFDTPSRQAIVPLLVPKKEFVKAVSLNSTMWQSAIVLGPSIGGFIIASSGVGTVYAFNAVSFLAVIISLILMAPVSQTLADKVTFNLKGIKEGLSFVRHTPLIWSTMLLDFFATFFASATVLMPIYAQDILRVGPKGLGFLYAAPAVGAVVTGLIISAIHHLKNQGKLLLIAVSIYGLATVLFGFSRLYYLSLIFLLLSGAGDVISTIIRNTARQLATPDYIRGRMSSVNMIFFMGGPQLGEVEAGFVAGLVNTPFAVISGGIATVLATIIIAAIVPQLRRYQGHEHLEIV